MTNYILHNYFNSTTSVRVRVALVMKGLEYSYKGYALLPNAHKSAAYLKLNRQGLVPALEINDGTIITQSMAILEYLEETHPEPALLPKDALGRARVRSLSHIISVDIHPVNNLRILRYLENEFRADAKAKTQWFHEWAHAGFKALETRLTTEVQTGRFCHGDTPTMADICLYGQMFNNARFGLDMVNYPTAVRIYEECCTLPAFIAAAPKNQPDKP